MRFSVGNRTGANMGDFDFGTDATPAPRRQPAKTGMGIRGKLIVFLVLVITGAIGAASIGSRPSGPVPPPLPTDPDLSGPDDKPSRYWDEPHNVERVPKHLPTHEPRKKDQAVSGYVTKTGKVVGPYMRRSAN
jgi:hypothetical protein